MQNHYVFVFRLPNIASLKLCRFGTSSLSLQSKISLNKYNISIE